MLCGDSSSGGKGKGREPRREAGVREAVTEAAVGTQGTGGRMEEGAGTQARVRETRAPVEQVGPRGLGELCSAGKELDGRSCSRRPKSLF